MEIWQTGLLIIGSIAFIFIIIRTINSKAQELKVDERLPNKEPWYNVEFQENVLLLAIAILFSHILVSADNNTFQDFLFWEIVIFLPLLIILSFTTLWRFTSIFQKVIEEERQLDREQLYEEPSQPSKTLASFLLLGGVGVFFGIRGLDIFVVSRAAIPGVSIFDIFALVTLGGLIALLRIRGYSRKVIIVIAVCYFLPILQAFFLFSWVIPLTGGFIAMLFPQIMIFPLILLVSYFAFSTWWTVFESQLMKLYSSPGLTIVRKITPEFVVSGLILILVGLAFLSPPLFHNDEVSIAVEGPQDVIDSYLSLEISPYVVNVEGIVTSPSIGGINPFNFVPNYLGATERSQYTDLVRLSEFWVEIKISIRGESVNIFTGQQIIDLVSGYHVLRYWNNSLHTENEKPGESIVNMSWTGPIYIVNEKLTLDNTVSTAMTFRQFIAYRASDESVIAIFSDRLFSYSDPAGNE